MNWGRWLGMFLVLSGLSAVAEGTTIAWDSWVYTDAISVDVVAIHEVYTVTVSFPDQLRYLFIAPGTLEKHNQVWGQCNAQSRIGADGYEYIACIATPPSFFETCSQAFGVYTGHGSYGVVTQFVRVVKLNDAFLTCQIECI
jgi:hypothetical protein